MLQEESRLFAGFLGDRAENERTSIGLGLAPTSGLLMLSTFTAEAFAHSALKSTPLLPAWLQEGQE